MGLSTKKSTATETSKSNTAESGTTTPVNPPWVDQAIENYTTRIGDFGNSDPYSYIAGTAPLQQQAFGNSSRLGGWMGGIDSAGRMASAAGGWGPSLVDGARGYNAAQGQATGYDSASMRAQSLLDGGLDRYMSPYTQSVVDSALAGFDDNAGRVRAQQAAQAAQNGAFGGSRYAIREAQTEADLGRERGSLDAGLRDQGFQRAAMMAEADAARRQQAEYSNAGWDNQGRAFGADAANRFGLDYLTRADQAGRYNADAYNMMEAFNASQTDAGLNRMMQGAGLLGDLSNMYGDNSRADLGLMSDMGAQQRLIEQGYAAAPMAQLQMQGQMYGVTPYDLFNGQEVDTTGTMTGTGTTKTKSGGSLFDSLLAAGQVAAMASDRRLKKDIEPAGTKGPHNLYRYRYNWEADDAPLRIGVMADEVAQVDPAAVTRGADGYDMVDYGWLGLAHLLEDR